MVPRGELGFEAGDIGDGYMAETIGAKGCPVGLTKHEKIASPESFASQLRIGTLNPALRAEVLGLSVGK